MSDHKALPPFDLAEAEETDFERSLAFEQLLAALPCGLVLLIDQRIAFANPPMGAMLGLSAAEMRGRPLLDFFDPADAAAFRARPDAHRQGERAPKAYEVRLVRSDGARVQVEVEPRRVSEGKEVALVRDLGPRVRDGALASALSEVAARVQRARTVGLVLQVAGQGLSELGLRLVAARLEHAGLVIEHVPTLDLRIAAIERMLGRSLCGLTVPADCLDSVRRALGERRSLFTDDLVAAIRQAVAVFPQIDARQLEALLRGSDYGRAVICPLLVQDRAWGVLAVAADGLSSADAAALGLFAGQIASALEVAESVETLERRNREIAAVHAVARAGAEPGQLVPQILAIAAQATESDCSAIYLLDAERNDLALAGVHGYFGALAEKHRRVPLDTPAGEAARSLRARALGIQAWPGPAREELAAEGFKEAALIPLHIDGRTAGSLSLLRHHPRPYTDDELISAEILASQIAIQLEKARLHGEERRRVRLLSLLFSVARVGTETAGVAPLADQVLAQVVEALAVDSAMIHLLEGDRLALVGQRSALDVPWRALDALRDLPVDERSLCGQAAASRQTVVADLRARRDWASLPGPAEGPRFAAAVPLIAKDKLIGVFSAVRRDERPFLAEEIQLLESCAAHLGVAIEHARLFEEERRRVHDLSQINELGGVLSQHLELSAVLSAGVAHMTRIAAVPHTFLALFEPDGRQLRIAASNLDAPWVRELVLPPGEPSVILEAVRACRPIAVSDLSADPRASQGLAQRFGHKALLGVPLIARGKPLGVLLLGDTMPRRFAPDEVDRAVAVANQLATAIANARLYEEERRRVEELKLLLDVSRVITASLDLGPILDASAVSLARLVGASDAFIWLVEPGGRFLRGTSTSAAQHKANFRELRLPVDEHSVAVRAMRARGPVCVEDALSSPLVHPEVRERWGMKSLLGLPLLLRDEPIGSVVIGDLTRHRRWTDAEIERATVVASEVAVAVANARLFEDLKRSYEELNRTQAELVKRERLAALGELSAVVAHEVRNPLAVIFNSLVSLRKGLRPTGEAAMLLDIVGEEADRLNRIVGDLLDFARPAEPALRSESLEQVISGALEAAARTFSTSPIDVAVETPCPLSPVPLDARMVRQALINLMVNAMQAMPKGGKVIVRATEERREGRAYARVDVSDNGPGLPQTVAERIFQPFITTKATGTGLGLAVVKRIVDAHHGEVCVESVRGVGTTFTLRLPMETRK